MKAKSLFLTNRGFTIIEMIFSLIILIFSLLTISSVSKMITDFSSRINSKQKLTNIKSDIINNISQNKVWQNLVVNADKAHPSLPGVKMNSSLLCLKNSTSCNVGTYDLTLIDMNGSLLTDPNTATTGFDKNGVACNSYGTDPECAFRFSLNWTAICSSSDTSCLNPQIKVKIMATSSNQLYTNTKTLSPFELLVNTEREADPVIKKAVIITNSTHHYASEASVKFDPSGYIFSENKTNFAIGLTDTTNSVNGGTLSTASNIIVYTPATKFYGFDQFQYKVTNPLNGKSYLASAWVWVMTPYTWTGLGNNTSTSTLKNFCGKVKSGACDGSSFPAGDRHFIFNSSCTNCTASLNSDAATLEMSKDFNGSIQQTIGTVSIGNLNSSTWVKLPIFSQSAGTFDGNNNILLVRMDSMPWSYSYGATDTAFNLEGGLFKAPAALRVVGPLKITNSASFVHNNNLVNVFKIYGTNSKVEAPNVHFYNLQFDSLTLNYGSHFEFRITDNFTVENNLIHSGRGTESSIRSPNGAIISVKGNVSTEGNGGTYGYVKQAIIRLDGDGDQGIYGTPAPGVPINASNNVNGLISFLPTVQIKKTSGKVTIKDWVGFGGFEVLETPATLGLNALDVSDSTFVFGLDCWTINFKPGDFTYRNMYFVPGGSCYVDVSIDSPTLNIDGNLHLYTRGASHIFSGLGANATQVNLTGDLHILGGFDHDRLAQAITINMIGSTDSKITGTNSTVSQAHININKNSGNKVEITGGFGTARDLKLTSGNLIIDPSVVVRIPSHGWNGLTSTFTTPNVQFHSMSIDHGFRANSDILLNGDLSIGTNGGGNYALSLGGTGAFMLQGNLNLGSHLPYGGGQKIQFTGVNDASINFTANPATQKNLGSTDFIINKETPSTKVTYNPGNTRINNLIVSRGTLEMISTSTIQASTATSVAGTSTVNKNGNNIVASSTNFAGVVNP